MKKFLVVLHDRLHGWCIKRTQQAQNYREIVRFAKYAELIFVDKRHFPPGHYNNVALAI